MDMRELEKDYLRTDIPPFGPRRHGACTREGSRRRRSGSGFRGVVIGRRGGGLRETFTVRKISYSIGVERVFPLHSPGIHRIEIVRHGRVRRAKLYYLRDLKGKAARIEEEFHKR